MAEPTSHIPRMLKVRGSPEFIGDTLRHLKTNWEKDLAFVVGIVEKTYADLEECRAWEIFPPEEPFGSEDTLLRKTLGITLNEFRVRIGKAKAKERQQAAAEATTGEVLPRGQGRPREDEIRKLRISQSDRAASAGVSTRQQEKLDALARKAPALLDAVRAGEISTHRACIQAGIVKAPTPLDNLRREWNKANVQQRDDFLAWLREQGVEL